MKEELAPQEGECMLAMSSDPFSSTDYRQIPDLGLERVTVAIR